MCHRDHGPPAGRRFALGNEEGTGDLSGRPVHAVDRGVHGAGASTDSVHESGIEIVGQRFFQAHRTALRPDLGCDLRVGNRDRRGPGVLIPRWRGDRFTDLATAEHQTGDGQNADEHSAAASTASQEHELTSTPVSAVHIGCQTAPVGVGCNGEDDSVSASSSDVLPTRFRRIR